MNQMQPVQLLSAVFLGVGLAASTGLNTSLPLLLLAAAARFHIAGVALNDRFGWLSSNAAIVVLIVAAAIEVIGDKFPVVDHALDAVGTFVRPLAGALAAAAVLVKLDPTVAAILGLVIGGPISLGLHSAKAAARIGSSATTLGCANPVLSLIEDATAVVMTAIALFMPLVVPFIAALVALILWRYARRMRRAT